MEEDSTSISSVEPSQTLQHAWKCTKNAAEIRALRVEINALSEMLRAFISHLDSASGELNGNKLGRSIMQEQEESLNSLSIIEDEFRLPCSTYEDFQNLNVKLEDVQVKAAVVNPTIAPLHCTYATKNYNGHVTTSSIFIQRGCLICIQRYFYGRLNVESNIQHAVEKDIGDVDAPKRSRTRNVYYAEESDSDENDPFHDNDDDRDGCYIPEIDCSDEEPENEVEVAIEIDEEDDVEDALDDLGSGVEDLSIECDAVIDEATATPIDRRSRLSEVQERPLRGKKVPAHLIPPAIEPELLYIWMRIETLFLKIELVEKQNQTERIETQTFKGKENASVDKIFEKECDGHKVTTDKNKISTLWKLTLAAQWADWRDSFLETYSDKSWRTVYFAYTFKFVSENNAIEWYSSTLWKLTLAAQWADWRDSFLETYSDKSWRTVYFAYTFKFVSGSLLDSALKKEKLSLETEPLMSDTSHINHIAVNNQEEQKTR
ncbi:hypothetical protein FQA39_LY11446 [Lamprigera yunnana]|nr:hypothetical protein FQA39_LY11446 [Lamprigera yunnana]